MKRASLFIGVLGLVLYGLGVRMVISETPSSAEMMPWRCLEDWSPIDGARFVVKDVAWAMDEKSFRFTVTKNAYWPCSQSATYIVNADGTEPRILENQDSIEWDRTLSQTQNASPTGGKSISWDNGFWFRDEFFLAVLDLEGDHEIEVSMEELLEDLEERAEQICIPEECKHATISDQSEFDTTLWGFGLIMPIALTLCFPALWVRRQHNLAKVGLSGIIVHLAFNAVILVNVFLIP